MNVTVCKSKMLKLFIESSELCIYIIDSGYVNETNSEEFMYHVIEESAYGESLHRLMSKSNIETQYEIRLDSYMSNDSLAISEEQLMNETLDLMLVSRKAHN